MPASRIVRRKVEIYATTLFEFASRVGTEAQALDALERFVESVSEVRSTVLVLAELGKGNLLPEVARDYEASIESGLFDATEAGLVAKTLDAAERNEHHEARVRDDLNKLAATMTDEVMQLLGVIGTGSDRRLLPMVLAKYKSVVDVKAATVPVEVTTAMPLDEELRASIIRKMTSELGKPVYLMEHVDPAIIGGLVLEMGDELRDASIRTQLENMRQTLTNPSVGGDGK
ncbi:FoF1 ATP synthase subunit delta [Olsenella uli]|uniref:F0F1 ATP synthase subunit delta n=1 Tax=Olsenella uli TaxID=133926 RepID=UPI0012AB333A|nr:F0F1 ATP synthase subunit delta [Olsenella uli]